MEPRRRNDENGALLLILMVGVAVMSIGVGVAAQSWSSTWRRENEEELMFRGGQYVDALLAYRKEHGGQFPTDLTELMKLGPRQLRYIRKLYRDPVNPTGQWGLLYLMPGGQGIFDPVLAQKQQGDAANREGAPFVGGMPGVTPITYNPAGTPGANPAGVPGGPGSAGLPGARGGGGVPPGGRRGGGAFVGGAGRPGALPGGGVGSTVGAPAARPASGEFSEDEPSEPPIGWPIVGVISRASGLLADNTFKIYKGHEAVNEWQFHVFERGIDQPQTPTGATSDRGIRPVGPGYGGGGIGIGPGAGKNLKNWPQGGQGQRQQNPKQ